MKTDIKDFARLVLLCASIYMGQENESSKQKKVLLHAHSIIYKFLLYTFFVVCLFVCY